MEQTSNIFEGEAIESDDDPNENFDIPSVSRNQSSIPLKKDSSKQGELPSSSVVVSGEASESDDEIYDDTLNSESFNSSMNKSVESSDSATPVAMETRRRRFQSPFHKKIWERNFALRLGLVQSRLDCYDDVINKFKSFIPIANRSQLSAQETLKNYRLVSHSSKVLNDNLEAVLHQVDIPDIKINTS